MLLLPIAVGLGARAAVAWWSTPADWEADGILWAWAGTDTRALAGPCRPAGLAWLWELGGALVPQGSVSGLRIWAVATSLLTVLCGGLLLSALAGAGRSEASERRRAGVWLAWLWALGPSLVWPGPRLLPNELLASGLCLTFATFVRFADRPGTGRWVALAAAAACAVGVGGAVAAIVLAVGALAFVAPLPRASLAVPVLLAGAFAVAAAMGVDRLHDDSRPWRPDTAPAYSLATLLEAPLQLDDRESPLPEVRGGDVWRALAERWNELPATDVTRALGRRVRELTDPARLLPPSAGATLLGALDAALLGGLLLLGMATVARRDVVGSSLGVRLAAPAALVALLVATTATATSPLALGVPLLVALPPAALAWSRRSAPGGGRAVAWLLVGGLLLGATSFGPHERAPSAPPTWPSPLTGSAGEGQRLVALLAGGGPADAAEHMQLAHLLSDPAAPALRRPLLARRHALQALATHPTESEALQLLVVAHVECLDFDAALDLARTLVDDNGQVGPRGRALGDWVSSKASRARLDAGR